MNEEDNKKVAYYVKCLLNNTINTNDVPVYLIPKINIVLTIAKKNAIANGQVNSVKQIQQIMAGLETIKGKNHHVDSLDQITNSRRRCQTAMTPSPKKSTNLQKVSKSPTKQKSQSRNLPNINQSHSQSPKMKKNIRKSNNVKSTKLNDSTFTKEQLDSVLEDLISGSLNEPQKEMIPELIHHSKEKTNSLIEKEELIEAQKYENITRKLITLSTDRINIENKSNRKEEFNSQLQKALNNLEIAQENLENDLKAYDAQLKDAREAQRIEWEQTLEDFDRVTSGELPKSYKKYSPKLLGLREASKNLIKLRRYEEAGYKKMEADELEEIEFEECRQKYITARQAQKAKIIESHNQKMQCFEENGERIRRRIIMDHSNKIHCLERSISHLQDKIQKLNNSIIESSINTPVPTPLPSQPLSPHRQKNYTFVTQQNHPKPKQTQSPGKTRMISSPQIMYRPIPSKWRIQTPQAIMKFKRE